ncbi:hypothetical protein HDV05_005234 [Chytridiales sp. JEL 0842]|nr:hypothetical protein HDV05_005234 [Chytridiales sp. JEL 0842]
MVISVVLLVWAILFNIDPATSPPSTPSKPSPPSKKPPSQPPTVPPTTPLPIRLPNTVVPNLYSLSLTVDPSNPEATYTGTVSIQLNITSPTSSFVLHAGTSISFTPDTTQLLHPTLDSTSAPWKPIKISRPPTEGVLDNTTILIEFADELQPYAPDPDSVKAGWVPTLVIGFAGKMGEGTIRGFYRLPGPSPGNSDDSHVMHNRSEATIKKQLYTAITHFEPIGARLAFPCFDEPALKAPLDLTIYSPPPYTAFANMPVASTTPTPPSNPTSPVWKKAVGVPNGWNKWEFERSPSMSTYLFAWGLAIYEVLEARTKPFDALAESKKGTLLAASFGWKAPKLPPELEKNNGTVVRVLFPAHKRDLAKWGLEVSLKSVEIFERLWGVGFPVPKMDMFPMPNFAVEGMENWGLVVMDEDALLLNPEETDPEDLVYASNLIAHEIAHHYFGDLTTMNWWTDLWLNEGFAEWSQFHASNLIFPEWSLLDGASFYELEHALGFRADESFLTHAVREDIEDPLKIGMFFDDVSYNKGASLIRMFELALEHAPPSPSASFQFDSKAPHSIAKKPAKGRPRPPRFHQALQIYLAAHAYGTATTLDLLSAIKDVDPTGGQLVKSFKGWIEKPGYPMLKIGEGDDKVMQEKFGMWYDPEVSEEGRWMVPVVWRWLVWNSTNWERRGEEFFILHPDERWKLPIADMGGGAYTNATLLLNAGRSGFFRTLYRTSDYLQIESLLRTFPAFKTSSSPLTPADRAGLFADVAALMLSGRLDVEVGLNLLDVGLSAELDPGVWRVVMTDVIGLLVGPRAGLYEVDAAWTQEKAASVSSFLHADGTVRSWLKRIVSQALGRVGLPGTKGPEDVKTSDLSQLRKVLVPLAAALNETTVVNWGLDVFYNLTFSLGGSLPRGRLLNKHMKDRQVSHVTMSDVEPYLPAIYALSILHNPSEAFDLLSNASLALPGDRLSPLAASTDLIILKHLFKSLGAVGGAEAVLGGGWGLAGFQTPVGVVVAWEALRGLVLDGVYLRRTLAEVVEGVVGSAWKGGLVWRDAISLLGTEDWRGGVGEGGGNVMMRFVRRGLERADAGSRFGKAYGAKLPNYNFVIDQPPRTMPTYQQVPQNDDNDVLGGPPSGGYAQVPLEPPPSEPLVVPGSSAAAASGSSTVIGNGTDGVFANLYASPNDPAHGGKAFDEFEPPSYQDAVAESAPPYMDATVVTSYSEDGEFLVEGGYGFLLKSKAAEAEMVAYRYDPDNFDNNEQIAMQNEWIAYLMIILGFFTMLRANAEFVKAQRVKAMIEAEGGAPV